MIGEYTYAQFRADVDKAWTIQPMPRDIRLGQMYFNALNIVRPDIANVLRGSKYDPFYRMEIEPATEEAVSHLW